MCERRAGPWDPSLHLRQDEAELTAADGVQVDCYFLRIMRPPHAQAISEAGDELEHGRDRQTRSLAARTRQVQLGELPRMNRLCVRLSRRGGGEVAMR
jgi:uncharacterized protein (DUF305 family)